MAEREAGPVAAGRRRRPGWILLQILAAVPLVALQTLVLYWSLLGLGPARRSYPPIADILAWVFTSLMWAAGLAGWFLFIHARRPPRARRRLFATLVLGGTLLGVVGNLLNAHLLTEPGRGIQFPL